MAVGPLDELVQPLLVSPIRRDPDSSQVADSGGKVVGFMLGEVRGGEFGLEEPTGWVEFFGVDPQAREKGVGRSLIEAQQKRWVLVAPPGSTVTILCTVCAGLFRVTMRSTTGSSVSRSQRSSR